MPITSYTIYRITLSARVTTLADTEEAALALGKTVIQGGGGDPTWGISKEVVQVVTPEP